MPSAHSGRRAEACTHAQAVRHPSSLAVQAALSRRSDATNLFVALQQNLGMKFIAVIGEAGRGKTHLAAELTAESGDRPSGIYVEAWPLESRGTIDDLPPRLQDPMLRSFERLLEAVESAGMRAGTRIPIVIDGLSDSEDPATWKGELEKLRVVLAHFQHVVVVVTLRPTVVEFALPENSPRVELQGFDPDSLPKEAIRKYFDHYRIDAASLTLPLKRFRDPLFLRIFCEATNPDRRAWVGPESVPASLVGAFIRFRASAVKRIANRPGRIRRDAQDILDALNTFALALWNKGRRAMPFRELRELIGDDAVGWPESLAWALVDEGILSRDVDRDGDQRTAFLFDAFAGFSIADALTKQVGQEDFPGWITDDRTLELLGTDRQQSHPLASDIREALAALVPRKFPTMQLWPLLDGELRVEAIINASELERRLLDEDSVNEISKLALLPRPPRLRDIFDRFRQMRDGVAHPLNAELLDRLLDEQSVADRDLRWSEWIRHSENEILWDMDEIVEEWQPRTERTTEDQLRALWVKWLLTSTVRAVRDHATRALDWYGRGDPAALFRLALGGLQANDPYVPERLLAAAFGVMMAAPGEQRTFGDELPAFLSGLWTAFCGDEPTSPTDHWLMREYVTGIVEVTRRYYPTALGPWKQDGRFAAPLRPAPIPRDDPRVEEGEIVYGRELHGTDSTSRTTRWAAWFLVAATTSTTTLATRKCCHGFGGGCGTSGGVPSASRQSIGVSPSRDNTPSHVRAGWKRTPRSTVGSASMRRRGGCRTTAGCSIVRMGNAFPMSTSILHSRWFL